MKKLLVLIIAIVSTNVNAGILPDLFAGRQANESVIENVKRSEFGADTDKALEALITHVAFVLARTGHKGEGRAIVKEFNENYRGYFARISMKGLGDHEPLSRWLADLYDRVEARVGKDIMHYARLDDIRILNFGLPVTFQPCGSATDSWSEVEYGVHFVPTAGAITYWSVFGACVGATYGSGSVAGCMPLAEVSRLGMEEFVAPEMSPLIYRVANENCQ